MGLTNPIQHGKVGFLSALIIIILLNLQISNLSQNLLKVVREKKFGRSTQDELSNNMTESRHGIAVNHWS